MAPWSACQTELVTMPQKVAVSQPFGSVKNLTSLACQNARQPGCVRHFSTRTCYNATHSGTVKDLLNGVWHNATQDGTVKRALHTANTCQHLVYRNVRDGCAACPYRCDRRWSSLTPYNVTHSGTAIRVCICQRLINLSLSQRDTTWDSQTLFKSSLSECHARWHCERLCLPQSQTKAPSEGRLHMLHTCQT